MVDIHGIKPESRPAMIGNAPKAFPGRSEQEGVTRMLAGAQASAVRADPTTLTHCYISLKSKPLAILVGPAGRGKLTLIETISQTLFGNDPISFQMMAGHAWWASGSGNIAFFTQAQTRFISAKLLSLIHEALLPENKDRLYLACMSRISPAELQGYFASLAFQAQHGEFIRLSDAHLSSPIPFPTNLLVVGTLDRDRFNWFDSTLMVYTSLIFWPDDAEVTKINHPGPPPASTAVDMIPSARVRSTIAARFKLSRLFRWPSQAFQPVSDLLEDLARDGVSVPACVLGDAIVYLANSWAEDGTGLFDSAPRRNLEIALDMAVAHAILPYCLQAIAQARLEARRVSELVSDRFPRTQTTLNRWACPPDGGASQRE